jgi:hypothetical protein
MCPLKRDRSGAIMTLHARMIRKSGNRFFDKIMRKRAKPGLRAICSSRTEPKEAPHELRRN